MNKIKNIYNLTALSIERYLQLNDWVRDYNFKNKNLMVFLYKNQKERKIAIPADEKFEGFYEDIKGPLNIVASLAHKEISTLIKEIITTFIDRIEFRIISDFSEDGKLPISYASQCIEGLKELILYSACAEQTAKPICPRATELAKTYLENFKLAQTEVGSFIINIETQVIEEGYEQTTLNGCRADFPFEHKIVKRICTAMDQIDEVVCKKKQLTEVADEAFETGITANMCEALLKMKPEMGNIEIDTTIRYASAITEKIGDSKNIRIKNHHFYVLDELSKVYRDKVDYQEVALIGIVKSLSKKEGDQGTENTIRLKTFFEDNYHIITIELSEEYYRIACNAHRDGKQIEVSGELDRSNKYWNLSKVKKFEILEIKY